MDKRAYTPLTALHSRSEMLWASRSPTALIDDIINGTINSYSLSNFLQNNSDYVASLKFIPLNIDLFLVNFSTDFVIIGNKICSNYTDWYSWVSEKTNVTLFTLTLTRTHNNFLDFAPYTKYTLYVPYFENIEIDPLLAYGHTLTCYVSLDVHTGVYSLMLERDDGLIINQQNVNIGIEISLGKSNAEEIQRNNVLHSISLLGSALTIGVGAVTGNPIATGVGISTATKGVTTALQNNVKHLTSYHGGDGNRGELICDKVIKLIKESPSGARAPAISIKGKPLYTNYYLSSLTGYTEIGDINFNTGNAEIYDDEMTEIIDLLHSGVIL